jgi:MSHA pilin protein MshA
MRRSRGFTLVELIVVIIILGVLGAIALPRFIGLGADARVAVVNTMASTLRSTTESVRAMCKVNADCDYGVQLQNVVVGGSTATLCYGWLCSGTFLAPTQLDGWINYAGFTASVPTATATLFTLDGAPDPANCSASYDNPYYRGPAAPVVITTITSGC